MSRIKTSDRPFSSPSRRPRETRPSIRRRFHSHSTSLIPFSAALLLCLSLQSGQTQPAASASALSGTNAPLDDTLRELVKPSKKLPFRQVIHATTGHQVLSFDTNNLAHAALRKKILEAAARAGERARADGLPALRANEAGNHLEAFVRAALKDSGLDARIPINRSGKAQAAGYPDIEITGEPPCYLELKTYSAATADTTQRTFYYSPSTTPKVTRDALHLLLAYQLERQQRDGRNLFVPIHWKLLTLEELEVDLKFEFNQSNRGLYHQTRATLDEGTVK
jgi:hypothetical protein